MNAEATTPPGEAGFNTAAPANNIGPAEKLIAATLV
jgi:hypothetical protein